MLIAEFVLSAPLVLLAAAASAVPLILHLLGRSQARTVEFPTMRFVRQAVLKTAYRRKIENLLLLLLRMGLFALLALALALPYYKSKSLHLGALGQTAIAVVLDNTASMQQKIDGKEAFEEAKLQAIRLIRGTEKIPAPGQAAVITAMGRFNRSPVISTNITQLIEQVRTIKPVDGETGINSSVLRAEEILSGTPAANKLIYVITDMQKSSVNLHQLGIQNPKFPILVLDVAGNRGSSDNNNIGIADVSFESPVIAGKPVPITVRLAGKLRKSRSLNLQFSSSAGKRVESKQIFLSDKQTRFGPFTFVITIDKAGFYGGKIEAKLNDALSVDNRWYLVFKVNNPVDALVVDDKTAGGKPSFFVHAALQSAGWIRLRNIDASGLTGMDLSGTKALYLCSLKRLSAGELDAIKRFLNLGTRVLVVFPDLKNITATEAILREMKLGSIISVADLNEPVNVEEVNLSSPLIEKLHLKSSVYRKLSVAEYLKVKLTPASDSLLILPGNHPLLVHGSYGGSDVYVFTTPAEVEKSNLPLNVSFPAILAQAAGDTVPSGQDYIHRAGTSFTVKGGPGASQLSSERSGRVIRKLPKGVDELTLYEAGVYDIKSGVGERKIAVNVSPKSTDLAPDSSLIAKNDGDSNVFIGRSLADMGEYLTNISRGKPLWNYVLFAVMLIMLGETLLANYRIK